MTQSHFDFTTLKVLKLTPNVGKIETRARKGQKTAIHLSQCIVYVPVKLKLQHPQHPPPPYPGNPRAFKFFGKFLFKSPLPGLKSCSNFECPIIGPFQVIKCPQGPRKITRLLFSLFSSFCYASKAVYVNMV